MIPYFIVFLYKFFIMNQKSYKFIIAIKILIISIDLRKLHLHNGIEKTFPMCIYPIKYLNKSYYYMNLY